jgi:hypothetical protein
MKKLAWAAAALIGCTLLASPAHAQQHTRPDRNRIRAEEIQASYATSVYQLIQRSRGMWLMRNHPTDSGAGAMLVFYDGAQLESVEDLRDIPLAGVQLIEFLNPAETEHRLGKYTTVGTIRVMSHDDTAPPPDSAHVQHR